MSRLWLLFVVACASSDETARGPLEDCVIRADGKMTCAESYPGCTFAPDTAVQFVRCDQRREYIVYGRADGCPELYVFPEGTFVDLEAWEDHVGECQQRQR